MSSEGAPSAALNDADRRYMTLALRLGRRGLGVVAPNPAVGCIVVNDGRIVGRGWTQPGGRPHAETEALARAGASARGATAYVTLEPCSHHGQTPPCADALIAAGVRRVVVAVEDPDPRVSGSGLAKLRDAGIAVDCGLMADEARAANAGFLSAISNGRPWVTAKVASSQDGGIATAGGESQWITGPAARREGHLLRARHDAIAVGSATVAEDDPSLTCRLEGLSSASPIRVVFDSQLQISPDATLVTTAASVPTWIVCTERADRDRHARLAGAGVRVLPCAAHGARPSIPDALRRLAAEGVTRLLVEGGGRLLASFLAADAIDEIVWLRAPMLLGGDARPAVAALALPTLAAAPAFERVSARSVAADIMETLRRLRTPG